MLQTDLIGRREVGAGDLAEGPELLHDQVGLAGDRIAVEAAVELVDLGPRHALAGPRPLLSHLHRRHADARPRRRGRPGQHEGEQEAELRRRNLCRLRSTEQGGD